MIKGVGIDIIEVQRVLEKISKTNGFKEKIFSQEEIAFCESSSSPGSALQHGLLQKKRSLKLQASAFCLAMIWQILWCLTMARANPV